MTFLVEPVEYEKNLVECAPDFCGCDDLGCACDDLGCVVDN